MFARNDSPERVSGLSSRLTLRYVAVANTKLYVAVLSGQIVFTSGSMAHTIDRITIQYVRAIRSAWKAYAYGVDVLSTQDRSEGMVRSGRSLSIRRNVLGFLCEGRSLTEGLDKSGARILR